MEPPTTLADFVARSNEHMSDRERLITDNAINSVADGIRRMVPEIASKLSETDMREHIAAVNALVVVAEASILAHIITAKAIGWTRDEWLERMPQLWDSLPIDQPAAQAAN